MENTMQLINGDCLEKMKDIQDGSIDFILCDLPYGTTACKWDSVIPTDLLWAEYERILKPDGVIALFGTEPFSSVLRTSNLKMYKYDVIWEKHQATNPFFAKKGIMKIHENISIFYKKCGTYNPQKTYGHKTYSAFKSDVKSVGEIYGSSKSVHYGNEDGSRYPTSILRFSGEKGFHPTQKPVKLLEYLIKTFSNEGETVLDNAMGSGSTGVACIHTGRNFIGIEKDEKYFNVAKSRIEEEEKNAER